MPKQKPMLLATAPDIQGMQEMITRFYAGTKFIICDDGTLQRVSDKKHFPHMRVVKKKGRFRFERTTN